ncbi:MAG: hypothetical protein JWM82_2037, partial [Myxococcales bacterium]|nr:hypothetical protein [Myxococcales bacterium]
METSDHRMHFAMGCLGALGLFVGCSPGTETTTSSEAAIKAASPACESARDACKAQVQPVVDAIEAACKPAAAACESHGHGDAGAPADCAAARAACKAAIAAAKPQFETIGAACESSIHQACVVDFGDGGVGQRHEGDGGERGEHDGGPDRDHGGTSHGGPVESAACEAAEMTCRTSLASLKAAPPTACTSIEAACAGQTPGAASDACRAAISGCHDAITTSVGTSCGADIAAACGGHGG